jgi:VCBS repeat-containing protein
MDILLIDDELHVRRALARSLDAWGHTATEVDTTSAAVAALRAGEFDLIVLDVNLPDGTGWDVLRAIHSTPNDDVPVIVISAIPPSVARLREFRPFAVLYKPFPIDSLIRLVERVAGNEVAERSMESGTNTNDRSISTRGAL